MQHQTFAPLLFLTSIFNFYWNCGGHQAGWELDDLRSFNRNYIYFIPQDQYDLYNLMVCFLGLQNGKIKDSNGTYVISGNSVAVNYTINGDQEAFKATYLGTLFLFYFYHLSLAISILFCSSLLGLSYAPIVETCFPELAVSSLDFSSWMSLGVFSILLCLASSIYHANIALKSLDLA